MRIFIFKSESGALSAFSGDADSRVLPSHHGPWHPIGVVRPDSDLPYGFSRSAIEQAITDQGFQLFRMKKKKRASLGSSAAEDAA